MLRRLAHLVDHPLARVLASLIGLAAVGFLLLFGVVVALTPPTPWMFVAGAGGLVGLLGWCLRVFVSVPTLAAHPFLRWTVCGALAIGIASISYVVLAWPDAYAWRQLLYPIGVTGVLLFAGTLAAWQAPDNSSKSVPLRGAI